MNNLIVMYLKDKELAWAPTTLRSERHRLNSVASLIDGDARKLWDSLQQHGAYGRTTIWTRVTDFYQWCIDGAHTAGPNPYKSFKRQNARLFKNAYQRKTPSIDFGDALARIETITDTAVRSFAKQLLNTGMRFSEPSTIDSTDTVVGKGSKSRRIYGVVGSDANNSVNYQKLRRALARVGLKPHDLRKIFLSRLVEMGANEFELCQVAGWASLAPALSYIKTNDERIKRLVQQVQGVQSNGTVGIKQVS